MSFVNTNVNWKVAKGCTLKIPHNIHLKYLLSNDRFFILTFCYQRKVVRIK